MEATEAGAANMSDPKEYIAGSSTLVKGVNSYTTPAELSDSEFVFGQNVVCRGGIVQTRPGTRSLFCLPDGNFQGSTLFTPDNGVAQLVFAVDGKIYVSAAPFTSYRRLWNLQFSITAKYIAWAVCLKSTDFDASGNLYSLEDPFSVLVMQDGLTRAAYWDGGTSAHLNPASPGYDVSDATDTVITGYNETPIGLWMIWSGNRLWVSRGNQIFASDIGNPLKFTEALYLNEGRAFNLSGPCTGMIEVPSDSAGAKGFIAFTDKDGTLFASYIQDRTQWLSTPLFQNTILPNIGCVAPRSLVTQYGLNWWFSPRGFTNLNAAFRQNLSSRIDYQDNQMFASKAYLGPDLSGICANYYENYLMVSVPSGDVLNRHTWVLDQAPMDGNENAWTGFWSGWRPIEWCRGLINGSERVFFGSIDYDGKNRMWEAMLPERKDNGCRITCYAQLRDHAAGNLSQKRYEWTKFFLSQILGDVDLNVYVASTKGGFQLQKGYHLVATEGQIFPGTQYSEAGPLMVGNRVQTRTIRTPSDPEDNACNECGIESKEGNMIDYAFSHLLVWSGQMGIRAYQMHMRESPEREAGDCEEDETGPRTLNAAGCSGLRFLVDGGAFPSFTGYAETTMVSANGLSVYIRRTSISYISQANADALALCASNQIVNQLTGLSLTCGVFESGEAEVGGGTYVIVVCPTVDTCEDVAITAQPQAQAVDEDDPAEFSITATGTETLAYQWQVSTNGGADWTNVTDGGIYSGATTNTLAISEAAEGMNDYQYRCIVSNACSEATSDAALLEVEPAFEARLLLVGGGGGGASGGGGGGQVIDLTGVDLSGNSYPIVIGAGGLASSVGDGQPKGNDGSPTTGFGQTATGGGGGGGINALGAGRDGGNGGGAGATGTAPTVGGNGDFDGGNVNILVTPFPSAGAAGAGENGENAVSNTQAGAGGDGYASDITGVSIKYAPGGGGACFLGNGFGLGGADGGGNGGALASNGSPGQANRGAGGGGGSSARAGGDGGSGVVYVRYAGAPIFTGGTVTTVGGDTLHAFTSSGTLTRI